MSKGIRQIYNKYYICVSNLSSIIKQPYCNMSTILDHSQTENTPNTAKIRPYLVVESVMLDRIVYNAGYNYTKSEKNEANFYISRDYTEADVFLYYELRGSNIKFHRYQLNRLVWYKIPRIDFNYFNLLCYEFNK